MTRNLISNFCRSLFALLFCGTVLADGFSVRKVLFIVPLDPIDNVVDIKNLPLLRDAIQDAYQNSGKYILTTVDDAKIRADIGKYNEHCTDKESCIVKEAEKASAELYLITKVNCPENQNCILTMIIKDTNKNIIVKTETLTTPKRDVVSLAEKLKLLSLTMLTDKVTSVGSGQMRTVSIRSNPSGAKLYIDDKPMGPTDWKGEISVGQHRMLIQSSVTKFAPLNDTIEVFPGTGVQEITKTLVTNAATVQLDIIPPQASVVLDGKPLTERELRIPLQEQKTIQISLKGYKETTFNLGQDRPYEEPKIYVEKIKLEPLPCDVDLITNPPGVTVTIDNEKERTTDSLGHLKISLESGKHSFAFEKRDFHPRVEPIVLEPGENFSRVFDLKPGNRDVSVEIQSDPSGADVEINGKSASSTPFRKDMQPGQYSIVLTKDDYYPRRETITVEPKKGFSQRFTLPSIPPLVPPMKRLPALTLGLFFGAGSGAYKDTTFSETSPAESATITVDHAGGAVASLGIWSQLRIWKFLGIRGAYSGQSTWNSLGSTGSSSGSSSSAPTSQQIYISSNGTNFHGKVSKYSEGGSLLAAGPAFIFQVSDSAEFIVHPHWVQSKTNFSFSGGDVENADTTQTATNPLSDKSYSSPAWTNTGWGVELDLHAMGSAEKANLIGGYEGALGVRSFKSSGIFVGQTTFYCTLSFLLGWF
ncbi:PEGA domain-containing protein [Bdellovibrionota bacterium FG-2]